MRTQQQSAFLAQRLFNLLFLGAIGFTVVGTIAAGFSLEAIALITGAGPLRTSLLAFLPLGNLIFFVLFFRWLSDLFKGLQEQKVFNVHVSLANKRLMWLCIAYLAFSISSGYLTGQISGHHDHAWMLDPRYTSFWVRNIFIGSLATVFFFNSRVFQEGETLQSEQDLTI